VVGPSVRSCEALGESRRGASWGLASGRKGLDDAHPAEAAGRTAVIGRGLRRRFGRACGERVGARGIGCQSREERAGAIEIFLAGGGVEAVVTDLGEAAREDVLEEPAEELLGGERCAADLAGVVLAIAEGDLAVFEPLEPAVGEGVGSGNSGRLRRRAPSPDNPSPARLRPVPGAKGRGRRGGCTEP